MWEYNDTLTHYGIMGMKWGVRRYQNPDGTLTAAGKRRYADKSPYEVKTIDGDVFRVSRGSKNNYNTKKSKVIKTWGEHLKEKDESNLSKKLKNSKLADKLNADASTFEKMMYNRKTRELAAKYVNEQNMTVGEATSKAQRVAIGNTVALSLLSVAGSVLLTKSLL